MIQVSVLLVSREHREDAKDFGLSQSCAVESGCPSFAPLCQRKIFFEFLNRCAKATSDENEKSEKLFVEFGHRLLYTFIQYMVGWVKRSADPP
jgi:hypothetical protein